MLYEKITHTFTPVCFNDSRVLILGTMPSPKSRENEFYYSHPQNRFWYVLAQLFKEPVPKSNDERIALLKAHKVALWDVIASCEICGAADSTIKNVKVNDIKALLESSDIRAVFTTGKKAYQLYCKYIESNTGIKAFSLPSTSPANARMTKQELEKSYSVILKYI